MTVLHAYFDNSDGTRNSVSSFAGVVSRPHQWRRFCSDWEQTLRRHGVQPPFHMTDYSSFAKQYARFRPDRAAWEALIVDLIRVIKTNTLFICADTVVSSECVVPEGMENHPAFRDFKDPYMMSMLGCLFHLAKAKREGLLPRGKIVCFFDRDEKRIGRATRNIRFMATEAYPDVYSSTFEFGNIRKNVPLQAADVVAYECMKRMQSVAIDRDESRPIRQSGRALFSDDKSCRVQAMVQGAASVLLRNLANYIRSNEAGEQGGPNARRNPSAPE